MHTYHTYLLTYLLTYHLGIPPVVCFDMGIPMSVRLEIGPLTWGAPCQWSENIEFLVH